VNEQQLKRGGGNKTRHAQQHNAHARNKQSPKSK
jgi:hypothetical protein